MQLSHQCIHANALISERQWEMTDATCGSLVHCIMSDVKKQQSSLQKNNNPMVYWLQEKDVKHCNHEFTLEFDLFSEVTFFLRA